MRIELHQNPSVAGFHDMLRLLPHIRRKTIRAVERAAPTSNCWTTLPRRSASIEIASAVLVKRGEIAVITYKSASGNLATASPRT
jgi:hypothetical protein